MRTLSTSLLQIFSKFLLLYPIICIGSIVPDDILSGVAGMNGLITVQREARGTSQIVIFIPVGKLLKFYNDQYNIYAGHEHF